MSTPSSSPKIALIGASGFIGLRTTEILTQRADLTLIPLVRSPASLAVLARQALDWRIASFVEVAPLAAALKGCDICIHAAIGDAAQIVHMAKVTYDACAAAGVRRLVWLSSASVFGQNCPTGTDDSTPLHDRHPLIYNNAKVHAERALQKCARDRRVELVMLRPGVVFGPRSRWITDPAADLRADRAGWLNHGKGICNTIYVDNLVEAMRLAAITPGVAGETFIVGDAETVTWREFLLPIAQHLGLDETAFTDLPVPAFAPERASRFTAFTLTPAYARAGQAVPYRLKRIVKGVLKAWPTPSSGAGAWVLRSSAKPASLTQELSLLQQCPWKLPHAHATARLGYQPPVTFAEGMKRSLAWLDFVTDARPA
ncbi:NAD-dependent epimerase/dehydratase family protein [Nibricoccus aquaticus]|nr:NAD(P)H-binding protein [Nibricoccus aquaticus]